LHVGKEKSISFNFKKKIGGVTTVVEAFRPALGKGTETNEANVL